jgi:hypothetical protein
MDKDLKDKFEKYLAENDAYGAILSKVKDEGERKKIKTFTEEFYMTLVQGFLQAQKIVQENPEKVAELLDKKISK